MSAEGRQQDALTSLHGLVSTVLGIGLLPRAPGFVASAFAAAAMALVCGVTGAIATVSNPWPGLLVSSLFALGSVTAAHWALVAYDERPTGLEPRSIVIADVAGICLAWLASQVFYIVLFVPFFFVRMLLGLAIAGHPLMSIPSLWPFHPIVQGLGLLLLYRAAGRVTSRARSAEREGDLRRVLLETGAQGMWAGLVWAILSLLIADYFWLTS